MFINDLFNDKNKTLNEVSNELLGRYKKAAGADASAADKRGDVEQGNKRFKGIVNATKKELDNDVKRHKKSPVKENDLTVPKGWQATTQPDGSTRISKQGSMSSAEYKQNMADYKAKNWTPEKIADYSQRMASGQGYTDAERSANYQQQQQHFGNYADTPLDEAEPTNNQPRTGLSAEQREQLRKDIDAVDYNKQQQPPAAPSREQKADIRKAVKAQEVKEQGMAEGKKPDNYHIVNKDGKPASLASYADRASAEKDRDAKHPGAEVRQVGPRGKVKGVSESGLNRPSDHRKLGQELAHETNNIEISINGRVWKIFAGKGPDSSKEFFQQKQAVDSMCKRKTAETGKKWSWGVTGAAATNEGTKCNMTEQGRACPDHGIMECPGYSRLMGEAFKMPPESVQDKLHKRHQELRKKSGLPDPEHYLKLKKQKEQELVALRAEIAADKEKGLTEERYLEELQRAGYDVITEKKIRQRLDPSCWKGYKKQGTKIKGGVRVNNCVPKE